MLWQNPLEQKGCNLRFNQAIEPNKSQNVREWAFNALRVIIFIKKTVCMVPLIASSLPLVVE